MQEIKAIKLYTTTCIYNVSVFKYMVDEETKVIKNISATDIKDQLNDDGIVRRIRLHIDS